MKMHKATRIGHVWEIHAAGKVATAMDAHVLAGARAGRATHLLTLDRKHFLGKSTRAAILPIVVCTPGEFLRSLVGPPQSNALLPA